MIILFVLFLLIKLIIGIPSNSYYLIDIDTNLLLNNSYCSNILISKNFYRIPNQCHKHLLCNAYHCDDKSFRCVKIRDTLCCLYKYLQKSCPKEILKDQFRSIYFHISIQHGYCEINLERIEQNDHSYCLANHLETTTTTTTSRSRSSPKHFHRYRTHLSNSYYLPQSTTNTSSKTSFIYINFIILLLLSILLSTKKTLFFRF